MDDGRSPGSEAHFKEKTGYIVGKCRDPDKSAPFVTAIMNIDITVYDDDELVKKRKNSESEDLLFCLNNNNNS